MRPGPPQVVSSGFRKPSGPTLWLMVGLFVIWLAYAIALNWGDVSVAYFEIVAGDADGVLSGEIWRLVTAAFLHQPRGDGSVFHILITLLLLYFFMPHLQDQWSNRRLFAFLLGSAAFAFAVETLMHLVVPTVARPQWYGGMVMADAVTVAWAVTAARGQVVRFYFVIPMKPLVMVGIMVVWHVLQLIAVETPPREGVFAPFAAMAAGWLFTEVSPLRRLYLKLKLKRLQSEVDSLSKKQKRRAAASHLRVIRGGNDDDDDDDRMLH